MIGAPHYLELAKRGAARPQPAAWLSDQRQQGARQFESLGLPTRRLEDWKYTDLSALERSAFVPPAIAGGRDVASMGHMVDGALPGVGGARLLAGEGIDGGQISGSRLPSGVTLAPLHAVRARDIERWLGGCVASGDHALPAFNASLWDRGAFLHVPAGVRLEEPVHLVYLQTGDTGDALLSPRTLVVIEDGASATVIEHYLGLGDRGYWTNAVTEIRIGKGGQLEHVRLGNEGPKGIHSGSVWVRQADSSRYVSHQIDLGGHLVRNDLHVTFDGAGAECALNGLYVTGGRDHVDNHTVVDHAHPDCTSLEHYKGVLDGRSRAVFSGRVIVREGAVQTDAQQMNRNLLLSRDAEIDTKPELQIFADDVKCSHGATVGSLDETALFYLRSRAIGESEARDLLTVAFAVEMSSKIGAPAVRDAVERRLRERLWSGRTARGTEGGAHA